MNPPLRVQAVRGRLDDILDRRERYRREMKAQIVHDSYHARGFTDTWLLHAGGEVVGYGAVAGEPDGPREVVKELFLDPPHRRLALDGLHALVAASGARWIEAQTNDPILGSLIFDVAGELTSDTVLFADGATTHHEVPGASVRPLSAAERESAFEHTHEPVGDWGVEMAGRIVATGGLLHHYNAPYADLYMEVEPVHQSRGIGRYLVQELKRIARAGGGTPSARCRADNVASRRTLESAGMLPCGRIVRGRTETGPKETP